MAETLTNNCFNRICRTCLSTVNKLKSFEENEDLLAMLTQLTPIKPDKTDILPKQICVVCVSKLNMVHNFFDTCIKAETDLTQAIEQDNQTLLNHLKLIQDEAEASVIEDELDSGECGPSDGDSDDFSFSIHDEDFFETEEHKLKIEDLENEDCLSRIRIVDVVSVAETNDDIFRGFNNEEIIITQNNLEKYTETVQTISITKNHFFDSIKYKCYLCKNKLNLENDKGHIKTLEFSTLNDDAHILCKKRIKVLRKIIEELYLKQEELTSLNNKWQKIFLQQTEKTNRRDLPTIPVTPSKPHETGYRKDGQVHLGHLTWIPEAAFDKVFRYSLGPYKFLSNMAVAIFGAETLAKSSISGISKNGTKKLPLNSIRMCALKSCLKYYMRECNVPEYYQQYIWKNFNTILSNKIIQITGEYKKRCVGDLGEKNANKKTKYFCDESNI